MHSKFLNTLKQELFVLCVLGAGIAVLLLSCRMVCVPQYRHLLLKQSELESYQSALKARDNYSTIKSDILSIQTQLQTKLDSLTAGQGNAKDISGLLEMLMERARAADVRFVKMQPLEEKTENGMLLYPVLLETTTTYNSLGRLIASMESIPHAMRVERLGISAASGKSITTSILVTCYLQKDKS
jgi:Tfp pilus assembly protein PilO